MKIYIKAYDHNEKLWTVFSEDQDSGKVQVLKSAKSSKDIQSYLNKKPKVKSELFKQTKNEYAFDGIIQESRVQKKIDRELKSKTLYVDDFVEIEKLSKSYNYKKEEVAQKKKKFKVKQTPSQAKYIENVSYFYTSRYGGRLSISQKNADRVDMIRKTLKGFTKVEFSFIDIDGNEFKTIIDKDDMVKDENILRSVLGKAITENMDDDSLNSGKGGKFSFRGRI